MGNGLFLLRIVILGVILWGCAASPPAGGPPGPSPAASGPAASSLSSAPDPSLAPEPTGPPAEEYEPVVIAIMPFSNLSGQKEHDWLCTGIAESVSTKLGSLPYFSLVERVKLAEAMKEVELGQTGLISEATAAKTGQMAGAEELVVGSFQVVGDTIRINARFLKVEEATAHTTAEATGKISEIFDLQDAVVASFLANMDLPLNDQEKSLLATKPTNSPEAFQLYSRAMDTYTPEGKAQSDEERIALLDQSTQIDPNFALAFISLGDIYFQTRRDYDRAVVYYDKAVFLRPHVVTPRVRLVQVYQIQGNTHAVHQQQQQILEIRRKPILRPPPEKQKFLEERRRRALIKFQEEQRKHPELQRPRPLPEPQKAHEIQKQRVLQEQRKAKELQRQRAILEQQKAHEIQKQRVLQEQQKAKELQRQRPIQERQKSQGLQKQRAVQEQRKAPAIQKRQPEVRKNPPKAKDEKKKAH